MKAYVFPGQGSQKVGMGEGLFDEFAELTKIADDVLGYSIKELCLEDKQNQLGQTNYTQPALFVVNALMYLKEVQKTGVKPDYVAGHSLGEYNALFAAGVFDFETGVKLVKKRGELMSKAQGGGMAAVIGLSEDEIRKIIADNNLSGIDIANINSTSQIVLSGKKEDVLGAQKIFEEAGAYRYAVLNVSGAFHSRYMEKAKMEFTEYIKQFSFSKPQIEVISNYTARPYKAENIKKNMIEQITGGVKWLESIRYLMGKENIEIEQIGPGKVLTGLVREILRKAEPLIIEEEEDVMLSDEKKITAKSLGNRKFKERYHLKYAYLAGGMYRGIASKEMVISLGKAGCMGFFGTGGLSYEEIEANLDCIQKSIPGGVFGMNLISQPENLDFEERLLDLYLKKGVHNVEASAYLTLSPAIVKYRLQGLYKDKNGNVMSKNHIIAKLSRPEVAEAFLSPAPEKIVEKLLKENKVTKEQAELSRFVPIAEDICIEADSGGHTDGGNALVLLPAFFELRDSIMKKYCYKNEIMIGVAGGIGIPKAAAAAFLMGADFVLTGSINQCTVEAATSDMVKDLLEEINIQDTEYAPAGDMFELGAKVQVVKRGLFFCARANKLYELYKHYDSIDEIKNDTKEQLQKKFFKKSFEEIYEEVKQHYSKEEIERAENYPKYKMALIFKWYFNQSSRWALTGAQERKVDFQIHCGPALGAFNQWVKGTDMEHWKQRHVDEIALKIMEETASELNKIIEKFERSVKENV